MLKESACQCRICRRCKFDPWGGKISQRRTWQPTPVFLPRKSHRQRSLAGCSPWGHKESARLSDGAHTHTRTHAHTEGCSLSQPPRWLGGPALKRWAEASIRVRFDWGYVQAGIHLSRRLLPVRRKRDLC